MPLAKDPSIKRKVRVTMKDGKFEREEIQDKVGSCAAVSWVDPRLPAPRATVWRVYQESYPYTREKPKNKKRAPPREMQPGPWYNPKTGTHFLLLEGNRQMPFGDHSFFHPFLERVVYPKDGVFLDEKGEVIPERDGSTPTAPIQAPQEPPAKHTCTPEQEYLSLAPYVAHDEE